MIGRALAAAIIGIVALAGPGQAQSLYEKARHYDTAGGQAVRIGKHSNLDRKCQETRQPNITVTEPPKHGSISTQPGLYTRTEAITCNGREVAGVFVIYTPAAGYKGDDRVVYTVPYSTDIQTNTVAISVH